MMNTPRRALLPDVPALATASMLRGQLRPQWASAARDALLQRAP